MYRRIFIALLAYGTLAACSPNEAQFNASKRTSDERACLSYGYRPGTTGFTTCVQREAGLRRQGVMPDYDEILIAPKTSLTPAGARSTSAIRP